MPVFYYARTSEGQSAAYDATSAMPRKLRSLLKVVDGKTSEALFASSLKAFGDVKGLLQSLELAGLIELREVDASHASAAAAESFPTTTAVQNHQTGFAPTEIAPSSRFFARETQPQVSKDSQAQAQQRQQDLQLLIQDMSSFVLAYVPAQAFTVLTELEQVTSMEQIVVLLGGYELMVNHVGEPAQIHLRHVHQSLRKWL
jgi:hypothetical protein